MPVKLIFVFSQWCCFSTFSRYFSNGFFCCLKTLLRTFFFLSLHSFALALFVHFQHQIVEQHWLFCLRLFNIWFLSVLFVYASLFCNIFLKRFWRDLQSRRCMRFKNILGAFRENVFSTCSKFFCVLLCLLSWALWSWTAWNKTVSNLPVHLNRFLISANAK